MCLAKPIPRPLRFFGRNVAAPRPNKRARSPMLTASPSRFKRVNAIYGWPSSFRIDVPGNTVTRLLDSLGQGNPSAAAGLLPWSTQELRRLARSRMAQDAPCARSFRLLGYTRRIFDWPQTSPASPAAPVGLRVSFGMTDL